MSGSLATLVNRGYISQALDFARRLSAPTLEQRVLQCELEALAANRESAMRLATALIASAAQAHIVVRALLVAGRIDFYYGRFNEGQQRFARAQELASRQEDPHVSALAFGKHIEALLRFVNLEAAVGHISQYRRAVIRTGTARHLATLHRLLAEAELKSGRSHRALKELSLARSHDEDSDDLYSRAQLELTHSAAHGLLGDVSLAYKHATRSADLARRAGGLTLLRNALTNVAHCQVLLGQYTHAKSTLESVLDLANGLGPDLDVRATELMLATATRNREWADRIDSDYGPLASGTESVPAQWYKLAQASHLIATGRAPEAAAIAESCLAEVGARFDRSYVDRTLVVASESLALSGRYKAGGDAVCSVALGPQGHLPEFIASTQRAQGLLAHDSPVAALDHFSRAVRIYGHIGHVLGRDESLRSADALRAALATDGRVNALLPPTPVSGQAQLAFGRVGGADVATSHLEAVAQTIRSAAAMVDLWSRPLLAGFEFLSLVESAGAAEAILYSGAHPSTRILNWVGSAQPDRSLLAASGSVIHMVLGSEEDRTISIAARPRGDGIARTTLLALQRLAANAQALQRLGEAESERSALWPDPLPEQLLGLVCTSELMLQLMSAARRVATSNFPVLITGETGTGKELLARAIHHASPRREQRFQPFNCSAVSRDMLDSQLFGYRRGAFTGAQDSFPGVIRNALGGTLMLDEIGELSLDIQPKLLRFLESNEVHPLGEPSPITVDVRVVAATNANLEKLVEEGRFREDLFYRLNVVQLTIPPLRDRREEIPLLVEHFLDRSQRECGKSGMRFGDTAAEYLLLYNWPGNVRELANEVRRAVALAESGAVLMPEHLSTRVTSSRRTVPASQRPADDTELVVRRDQPLTAAVEHVERALIQDALRAHPNVEDAARALGLSRKGLYLKRQRLKLDE